MTIIIMGLTIIIDNNINFFSLLSMPTTVRLLLLSFIVSADQSWLGGSVYVVCVIRS